MAMIVNQNPPQPRIRDEIEQDLDDQIFMANILFRASLFVHAGTRFLDSTSMFYFNGWLNIQNPPFYDDYYMLIGYYCLIFICIPVIVVICLDHNFPIMRNDWVQYYFVVAEYGYILMTLAHLLYHGSLLSFDFFIFIILGSCSILRQYNQWYIASKNLKEYQHRNRHRLSYILNGIKGA